MNHTTQCLRFGKSSECPVCTEINNLIKDGKTKKEIKAIMRQKEASNYLADLHNIRVTIVKINV